MPTPTINPSDLTNAELLNAAWKNIVQLQKDSTGYNTEISNALIASIDSARKLNSEKEKERALAVIQESSQKKLIDLIRIKSIEEQLNARRAALSVTSIASQQAVHNQIIADLEAEKNLLIDTNGLMLLQTTASANFNDELLKLINGQQAINDRIRETVEHRQKEKEKTDEIKKSILEIEKEILGVNAVSNILKFNFITIIDVLSVISKAFSSIETAAFNLRKNLGLVGKEGNFFKTLITDVTVKFTNIGVTAENVGKTITDIAGGLGSALLATQEMVENFSILETSLGISSEQSVKVSRTLAGISKSSSMSQSSMIGFTKELSKAAGTSFIKVMEDLANLTESVRLTFRGTTTQLIKSTVEARRFGFSIADVGAAAEKLLDFQESINAEIEASVMLGKNISFNEARALAYKGDILAATKNILDTVEKTGDLNQLDYFTLKNIAAASGFTVDKLQDSLQLRKDIRLVESMGTEEARKQAEQFRNLEKLSDSFAKSEGERALENLKNVNNLEIQKQLQTELNGLIIQLGQAFLPVLQSLASVLQVFTNINGWLREILTDTGAKWTSAILLTAATVVTLKGKWIDMFSSILKWMKIIKAADVATGAAGGAAGATGTAASGVAMWKNLLGAAAIIVATAAALYIVGKALKQFPSDIGGMGYMEFFLNLVGGLSIFLGFATGLGYLVPLITKPLIFAGAVFVGLAIALAALGFSLQSIANPIKTFSDSFSKLTENLNVDNLINIKDGAIAVKEAMSEIRGELGKFSKDDLNVLDKLGNLKSNISAGIKTEGENKKDTANLAMAEAIKSAVMEGMKHVKINVTLDGRSVGNGVAFAMDFYEPAGPVKFKTSPSKTA